MMRPDSALSEIRSEASEITYEVLRHHLAKDAQQHETVGQSGEVLFAFTGRRGQPSSSSSGTSR
jgi:hypothetical protein